MDKSDLVRFWGVAPHVVRLLLSRTGQIRSADACRGFWFAIISHQLARFMRTLGRSGASRKNFRRPRGTNSIVQNHACNAYSLEGSENSASTDA